MKKIYIYFQFYHEFIKVGFEKFNFFMVRAIIDNKNIPKGVIFVPLYPGVTLSWEPSFIEIHNTQLHVKGTKVIADIVVLVIFKDKLNLCPALLVCWKIYSCTEVLVHFLESQQIFQSIYGNFRTECEGSHRLADNRPKVQRHLVWHWVAKYKDSDYGFFVEALKQISDSIFCHKGKATALNFIVSPVAVFPPVGGAPVTIFVLGGHILHPPPPPVHERRDKWNHVLTAVDHFYWK